MSSHKPVLTKIEKWRHDHDDWKSLAAFAVSKTTGRRFKKNKPGAERSDLKVSVGTNDNSSELTGVCQTKSDDHDSDMPDVNSHSIVVNSSKGRQKLTDVDKPDNHRKAPSVDVKHSLVSSDRDVTVKQITLGELSDEELFLPPAAEAGSCQNLNIHESGSTVEDDFFVDNDTEGSDDDIMDEALSDTENSDGKSSLKEEITDLSRTDFVNSRKSASKLADQKAKSLKQQQRMHTKSFKLAAGRVHESFSSFKRNNRRIHIENVKNDKSAKFKDVPRWTNSKSDKSIGQMQWKSDRFVDRCFVNESLCCLGIMAAVFVVAGFSHFGCHFQYQA